MLLNKNNTKWIFLCGISSEENNKLRHLKDIAFGVLTLQHKGVNSNQIEILIDEFNGYEDDEFVETYLSQYSIKSHTDLHQEITSVKEENLVLIVLGHGNEF